uniref:Ataxin 7 like 2 n=1 Tax=Strigops habroptila TaxID=2489341 RepID=A0A672UR61_STRHB
MAAAERRVPGLDEFAGQSWSAWVQRAAPPAEHGSGLELEESGKSSSKKLDTMTLIKEDMNIFGHCPAHDEFYLVVCNHCSQVVKPQAFQKHCERRHGPLSKLYARATKCHVTVNGTPGTGKALREKHPGARGRPQPLPERADKDNNLCAPAPGEKPPSHPPGKPQPGLDTWRGVPSTEPPSRPPSTRCLPLPTGKECDLNRQCGVLNPDTNKLCTRLLTCKIHSVHQRREVQGRDKDFDVLVAELKASSRRGDPPKDRSPPGKEPPPPAPQDTPSLPQPVTGPPSTVPCRAKLPHCPLLCFPPTATLRMRPPPGDGGIGVFPLPVPKGGPRVSSEDSEEEGGEEPPRPPPRPPRPQAFCTFGSRLVSPGCYVFNRRLDRFCAALGSMLERHLSSHMWRKIPPAADPPLQPPRAPPSPSPSPCSPPHLLPTPVTPPPPRPPPGSRVPPMLLSPGGSPHAAAACSQPEEGGCSRAITSPLPANTPSPSFSKLPSSRAGKASRARECRDAEPRKWKPPLGAGGPPYKRACAGDGVKSKAQTSAPPGKTKGAASVTVLNGTTRGKRLDPPPPRSPPVHGAGAPPPPPPRCIAEEEVKKRKNAATYCRGVKARPAPPPPGPPPAPTRPRPPRRGGSVRRKKMGTPPGFEEKRSSLKSKAH